MHASNEKPIGRLAVFPACFPIDFVCGNQQEKWQMAIMTVRNCSLSYELVIKYLNFVRATMGDVATARTLTTSYKFFVQHRCNFGQSLNKWMLSKDNLYVSEHLNLTCKIRYNVTKNPACKRIIAPKFCIYDALVYWFCSMCYEIS